MEVLPQLRSKDGGVRVVVNTEKLNQIIEKYGKQHQLYKVVEELSELQTLVIQEANDNGKVPVGRISEEIADAYVVLKQLEIIKCLDDRDIQPIIDYKIERTLNRANE